MAVVLDHRLIQFIGFQPSDSICSCEIQSEKSENEVYSYDETRFVVFIFIKMKNRLQHLKKNHASL